MAEPVSEKPLSVEDVVALSVENPASYFHGAAMTALMRYRAGGGVEPIRQARAYLDYLEKVEQGLNMPPSAVPAKKK